MKEKEVLDRVLLDSPPNRILFRQNVGLGWAGQIVEQGPGFVGIKNPRPLEAGLCKGSSDLIGWQSVEITPEMVGQRIAQFVAIEVKTGKVKTTPEQENFLLRVKQAGGHAELIRFKD